MTTATTSEAGASDPGYLQMDADDAALRLRVRTMVRTGRQERGLTQAELGKLIGTSRFTINRIEAGATDVTAAVAEQLEQALGLTELRSLVARRDRAVAPTDNSREAVVRRMLGAPGLQRLRVVLADELNLYPLVFAWSDGDSVLRSEDVEIIVPTVGRVRELFGENGPLYGHIEYQIKRLLDLKKSDHYAANSLRLYESDDVIASLVVAATRSGAEGALWPPMATRGRHNWVDANIMPVGVTTDQHAISQLEAHMDALKDGQEPLRSNEALCRVAPVDDQRRGSPPVFTRYFTVGEDQEEDVDDSEGTAVALVLVVALSPRRSHGLGRRVITYMRSNSRQDRRRSLFSNTVEDVDIQHAREIENGAKRNDRRSTKGALAAALEINDYLESHSRIIPDLAYQLAAGREMAMFDLSIEPDRLRPVPLPPELRLIRKPAMGDRKRAAIAPRLFLLELKPDQPEPELVTLQAKADVEEVGSLDLAEDTDLNDFLAEAKASGFLGELLAAQHVTDR